VAIFVAFADGVSAIGAPLVSTRHFSSPVRRPAASLGHSPLSVTATCPAPSISIRMAFRAAISRASRSYSVTLATAASVAVLNAEISFS
jgi:hypothetical protein